jgi:hypothetical protein
VPAIALRACSTPAAEDPPECLAGPVHSQHTGPQSQWHQRQLQLRH